MGDNEKPTTSKPRRKKEEPNTATNDENLTIDAIRQFFAEKLNLRLKKTTHDDDDGGTVIADLTFDGLTKHWNEKGFKNIITMVGAGISTSAGIPDFRSPGSGLYDNLQKYNLPHPTAIFDMEYFDVNPKPFFTLAKELYPGTFNPTPSHYFVRLLHEKGLLLRHYTQNIDTLERVAGIPNEKLVEAHGTFHTNHCLGCRQIYSMQWMKEQIFSDCIPKCSKCKSVVKPDIVFFGENLPEKFYRLPAEDFSKCDLLIVMGTSLEVHPFAGLVDRVGPRCVRLLINRTKVGNDVLGLLFDDGKNTRDVTFIGDCDDGVLALAKALSWDTELQELIKREHLRLSNEKKADAIKVGSMKGKKKGLPKEIDQKKI